jgi:hypothetical protein
MSRLRDKLFSDMRRDRSSPGYLGAYLAYMRSENPEGAEAIEADVMSIFSSDEGLRVLKLLEKSTLFSSLKNGSDDRALREMNAVRNFVLEIRRIVSHGAG